MMHACIYHFQYHRCDVCTIKPNVMARAFMSFHHVDLVTYGFKNSRDSEVVHVAVG